MSDNIDTSILRFTVAGADALKTTLYIFRRLGINAINRINDPSKTNEINEGSFSNFRTKTYEMQLGTDELKSVMAGKCPRAVHLRQERFPVGAQKTRPIMKRDLGSVNPLGASLHGRLPGLIV